MGRQRAWSDTRWKRTGVVCSEDSALFAHRAKWRPTICSKDPRPALFNSSSHIKLTPGSLLLRTVPAQSTVRVWEGQSWTSSAARGLPEPGAPTSGSSGVELYNSSCVSLKIVQDTIRATQDQYLVAPFLWFCWQALLEPISSLEKDHLVICFSPTGTICSVEVGWVTNIFRFTGVEALPSL